MDIAYYDAEYCPYCGGGCAAEPEDSDYLCDGWLFQEKLGAY